MRKYLPIIIVCCLIMGIAITGLFNSLNKDDNISETQSSLPVSEERVVSEPDEPVLVRSGSQMRMYGSASFYDYTFDEYDVSRPCVASREDCYTEGRRLAAMRDVPRGTLVNVTNLNNGKSVEVLVSDFGPDEEFHPSRIIDLSSFAFSQIADLAEGVIEVKLEWDEKETGSDYGKNQ